jgi:hypothetical protein
MRSVIDAALICERCHSTRVRRVHADGLWQRLLRSVTSRRRYACSDCGHRGWISQQPGREQSTPASAHRIPRGRPLESRDFRASRRKTLQGVYAVALAVLLGTATAYLLTRIGR